MPLKQYFSMKSRGTIAIRTQDPEPFPCSQVYSNMRVIALLEEKKIAHFTLYIITWFDTSSEIFGVSSSDLTPVSS